MRLEERPESLFLFRDSSLRLLVVVILGVMAGAMILALMLKARGAVTHRWLLSISIVPPLLTVLVPLPFSLAVQGPTAAVRAKLLGVTRAGILLSFILSTVGALLLLRALFTSDRQNVVLLGVETAQAALPALVFVVSYLVFR